jgi:hypothetical protein
LENPEIAEKRWTNRWIIDLKYHPSGTLLEATHNDDTVYIWGDLEEEQLIDKIQLYDPSFKFVIHHQL